MNKFIRVDGMLEFGLFERNYYGPIADQWPGREVSYKGYKRIKIDEGWLEFVLPDQVKPHYYTPGGSWVPGKVSAYAVYVLQDGVLLARHGQPIVSLARRDHINIAAVHKMADAVCPRCGDRHRCEGPK